MTLRLRLTLTAALFTVCALAVGGFLVNSILGNRLIAQVDEQLAETVPFAATRLAPGRTVDPLPDAPMRAGARRPSFPQGTYVALFGPSGRLIRERSFEFAEESSPPQPNLPAATVRRGVTGPTYLTVPASDGTDAFRALAQPLGSDTLVVAIPLTAVDATLAQLTAVQLGVGGGVVLILSLITYVAVRAETRPLERMTNAAAAIAGGDFDHRLDDVESTGDVGRLASAFDVMLTEINSAIAARDAAAAGLREFISDASHELRTPLTSIRGYAEMFQRAELDPQELATAMRRIEQEAGRMAALVDNLLALARLDEQRPSDWAAVDLAELVEDAASDARAADSGREITTETTGPLVVAGDRRQLAAAVANLWRNALLHTPPTTPVQLSARSDDGTVVIDVVDHGPGIPVGDRELVFRRLWRADAAEGRAGAGLGLSIAARIIELHGGSIEVLDTPGGGATFRVRVPAGTPGPS